LEKFLSWRLLRFSHLCGIILWSWASVYSLAAEAAAVDPVHLQNIQAQINLHENLSWTDQRDEQWSPDEAFSAVERGHFGRESIDVGFFNVKPRTFWFHFRIGPEPADGWLVHSEQVGLESFALYFRDSTGAWKFFETGESIAWDKRPLSYGKNTLRVPNQSGDFLLRIRSRAKLDTNVELIQLEALLLKERKDNFSFGLFYGMLLVGALLFLFARLIMGVRHMGWLAIACVSYALLFLVLEGDAAEFFWSAWPISSIRTGYLTVVVACGAHCSFVCARIHNRALDDVGNLRGLESIVFLIFIVFVGWLPLGLAAAAMIAFTVMVGAGLAFLGKQYNVGQGERRLTSVTSSFGVLIALMVVLELSGVCPLEPPVKSLLYLLLFLMPVTWLFGASRYYRQLQAEHTHAHQESLGFQNQLNEALESRLQIFSSIAHHLNNPLNYILLGVAKARDELDEVHRKVNTLFKHAEENPEARAIQKQFDDSFGRCSSLFGDALFGVKRAARVVDEMRGLANIDGETSELVPLEDILSSMKARVEDDLGKKVIEPVRVEESYGNPGDHCVYGNPYLIIHALKNIVNNGYLFARRSVGRAPVLKIEVDTRCRKGWVRVLISNNGPPVIAEHESSIFRMGYSTYGRRGTGLNVSQSILRETGGTVLLEDNGQETGWVRFSVTLPKEPASERAPASH